MTVGLSGTGPTGELGPVLTEVIDPQLVRVLDLVVISKSERGDVETSTFDQFVQVGGHAPGIVSTDDLELIAQALAPNSSAVLLVYEDTWKSESVEVWVDDDVAQLERLADLHHRGAITDEELRASTARILHGDFTTSG